MTLTKRLKRLFCRHRYQVFANIYGDLVESLNARTVLMCTKCGKRKFIKKYVEAPINYNSFLRDCSYCRLTGVPQISSDTVKNPEQYEKLFGPQEGDDVWSYDLGGYSDGK